MLLATVLIKLSKAGAPLSYRTDQLPTQATHVPGERLWLCDV